MKVELDLTQTMQRLLQCVRRVLVIVILGMIIWAFNSMFLLSEINPFNSQQNDHPDQINVVPPISKSIPSSNNNLDPPSPPKPDLSAIPTLFIMASPKSGSSSLVKWLLSTNKMRSDTTKVENNELWKPIDRKIQRNDAIGFELTDEAIQSLDDSKYINTCKKLRTRDNTIPTFTKSVFYLHIPYMARLYALRYPKTKILITVRNPVDRLLSNYLFFIGDEKKALPNKYGDINTYLQYIMDHELLRGPFDDMIAGLVKIRDDGGSFDYDTWKDVLMHYKLYLMQVIKVCQQDFMEMGFDKGRIRSICVERDLIRSAIGSSCYIIPIMHWYLQNVNTGQMLRILQSEMMFKYGDQHVTQILCWVNGGCGEWNHDTKWNTGSKWRESKKSEAGGAITQEIKHKIVKELSVCKDVLEIFIQKNKELQIYTFNLSVWDLSLVDV